MTYPDAWSAHEADMEEDFKEHQFLEAKRVEFGMCLLLNREKTSRCALLLGHDGVCGWDNANLREILSLAQKLNEAEGDEGRFHLFNLLLDIAHYEREQIIERNRVHP